LCSFLHFPVTSALFGPNILLNTLNTLFSNILSLCSSFKVRDQVSYSYKTTDKIISDRFHYTRMCINFTGGMPKNESITSTLFYFLWNVHACGITLLIVPIHYINKHKKQSFMFLSFNFV
jgi:hypothetical protein